MQELDRLAHDIDAASDAGDEPTLRKLSQKCDRWLDQAVGDNRVYLHYYKSNAHAAIIASTTVEEGSSSDWNQPDAIQNILSLRRAINEPSFENIDVILTCQIRTNLGIRLNSLGRPVAANEQCLKALSAKPDFAKGLANRAKAICLYTTGLYDQGHQVHLLVAARDLFDSALDKDAFWESHDRDSFADRLIEERNRIQAHLVKVGYDENFDLSQWSLGASEEEQSYRLWCLRDRLFLNPLNEAYTDSAAATDIFHLPSHTYAIEEPPRFPAYYNLLKQEYTSARYRLYCATHRDDPDFLMRDVLMFDSGESQMLGHYTEDLRAAFRSAYSIFDKIGLFLNDYFQIGLRPGRVTFRRVWSETPKRSDPDLRSTIWNRPNWPLRGLYFLSRDLFDEHFEEASESDAADLALLRNQVEHRFLSLQRSSDGTSTDIHRLIAVADFENKALRLLRMAREALIYLSLAMYIEEASQHKAVETDNIARGRLVPRKIRWFNRSEAAG